MAQEFHVTEVCDTDGLCALEDEWRSLHASSPWAHPFNSFGFVSAWWDAFRAGKELHVFVARTADGVVRLIAPLYVGAKRRLSLRMIGDPRADYMSPLVDPETPQLFEEFLEWLHGQGRWQDLRIKHMRSDGFEANAPAGGYSTDAGWLQKLACWGRVGSPVTVVRQSGVHPQIDQNRLNDLQDLLDGKNYVRPLRWFSRNGRLEFRTLSTSQEILARLDEFFEQHVEQFTTKRKPSLFTRDANRRFYRELARRMEQDGLLKMHTLCFNDRLVAAHVGFVWNGILHYYKPAYSLEFSSRRPGKLLLGYLFRQAAQDGCTGIDLLKGLEPFKELYCSDVRKTWTLNMYCSRWSLMGKAVRALRKSMAG